MIKAFLSYARGDDEAFVRRLYEGLESAAGPDGPLFDVWLDRVSMPSRSLTFHQEIRNVVHACDRLILVVGPKAVTSDYVAQEWQFAYFAANKCVNPIVRLDGQDTHGAKVDGYALIPEDLKLLHAEDFRDDSRYEEHLQNLIRQLAEPLPPVGKLVAVPELPPGYRAQPERLRALRDLLLIDLQKPAVVTGAAARVGVQGMGGIGKSVLANALAHHPEIQRAFRENIYWISFGQTPHIEEKQRWLARQLGDEGLFNDAQTGKETLRRLLADRAALLILDDVWERAHAEAFNVAGPLGRILMTTRDAGLVSALASRENHYQVQLPSMAEAEALLAAAAEVAPEELPTEAREIIAKCGRLPLALALCGGMANGGTSWQYILEALQEHDLEFLSADHPVEEQHRNAWVAMDVSLRALPKEQQGRFAELAVFGLERDVPEAAVAVLWEHTAGLSPRHSVKLLADLVRRSLVERVQTGGDSSGTGLRVSLHDLVRNFAEGMAAKRFGPRATLHRVLLDAYGKHCPDGWASGPDDGYFLQNLCGHLIAAERVDDAVTLLTDLPWVEAKSRAGLVFELADDYRQTLAVLPEMQEPLREEEKRAARMQQWTEDLIRYACEWSERRAAAHDMALVGPEPTLPKAPEACRMWTDEEVVAECRRIVANPTRLDRLNAFAGFVQAECNPLLTFGMREGFVLQHAFSHAPAGPVHDAANRLLPECNTPILLRRWPEDAVWNPRPALLRTLEGHSHQVTCVSVTPDGRRAVTGFDKLSLWVWDLENGRCLRTLEGPNYTVECVSMTPDGRRAVSGIANTLWIWDLESGQCLRILEGHSKGVTSVSVTPDGRRAVSGSWDEMLRVWDLESGQCLRTLEGHREGITIVTVTPDGRLAVSGSRDKTLQIWDLESGQCRRIFEFEGQREHFGISLSSDGRRAVSWGSPTYEDNLNARVWDLESGQCLRILEFEGHGHDSGMSVTWDGRRAVSWGSPTWGGNLTTCVWDLENGKCLRIFELEGHGSKPSMSVTSDGRRAVSWGGWEDPALRIWDLESGQWLRTMKGHHGEISSVSCTPDGRRAVSGSHDETLQIWDLESGQCLRIFKGHSGMVDSVSVMPDGLRAVSGGWDKTLRVWDLESGQCLRILDHGDVVRSVCVTPDGRRALSGGIDYYLKLWDLEDGLCLRTFYHGFGSWIFSASVTPDGRRAVSGTGNCTMTLRVWDLESGQCLHTLEGHSSWVWGVSVTPDGRRAVSGSWDKTLRVWDLESGQCLRILEGHNNGVRSVCVTPDGRRAVSGGIDKSLRVWDLESGLCTMVYAAPTSIAAISIVGSGSPVLVGTTGGEVMILDILGMIPVSDLKPDPPPDTSDEGYWHLLRRGLDISRRERGPEDTETLAHLAALAVHLDKSGKSVEAAEFKREHDEILARLEES